MIIENPRKKLELIPVTKVPSGHCFLHSFAYWLKVEGSSQVLGAAVRLTDGYLHTFCADTPVLLINIKAVVE